MNKKIIISGIIGILLIGFVIAQVNIGLPANFGQGYTIFEICDYEPPFEVSYEIINQTTNILQASRYIEVQGKIYTNNKNCVKGYKFNATINILQNQNSFAINELQNYLINSAQNITQPQGQNNFGSGSVVITG